MKNIIILIIIFFVSCQKQETEQEQIYNENIAIEIAYKITNQKQKIEYTPYILECTGECKKTPVDSRYGILVVNDDLCRCKPTTLQQKEVSSGMGFPINY